MKNNIIISIDSESDSPITFSKAENLIPKTVEEARTSILVDIKCLVEALGTMIHIADQNEYGNKTKLIEDSILTLHQMLPDKTNLEENEKIDNKI